MANATIDALYAGSLRLKISYFFLNNFTFYKWYLTKVAHCICYLVFHMLFQSISMAVSYHTCITSVSEYSKSIRLLFK